jgi:Arc/MetJ-type ribon-helix-helix transcriptional regulator
MPIRHVVTITPEQQAARRARIAEQRRKLEENLERAQMARPSIDSILSEMQPDVVSDWDPFNNRYCR